MLIESKGHSLGGSYSSMCFTELLRQSDGHGLPDSISLGDLYTHGSPRIGGRDFATAVMDNVKSPIGSSWRIANVKDIVPQIPPMKGLPTKDVFIHVNSGYQIYSDQKPTNMPSEIVGTDPSPGPLPTWGNIKPHSRCLSGILYAKYC